MKISAKLLNAFRNSPLNEVGWGLPLSVVMLNNFPVPPPLSGHYIICEQPHEKFTMNTREQYVRYMGALYKLKDTFNQEQCRGERNYSIRTPYRDCLDKVISYIHGAAHRRLEVLNIHCPLSSYIKLWTFGYKWSSHAIFFENISLHWIITKKIKKQKNSIGI